MAEMVNRPNPPPPLPPRRRGGKIPAKNKEKWYQKDFNFYPHYYTYGCGKSWRFFLAKTVDKIGDLPYTSCIMGIRACLRTLHF